MIGFEIYINLNYYMFIIYKSQIKFDDFIIIKLTHVYKQQQ